MEHQRFILLALVFAFVFAFLVTDVTSLDCPCHHVQNYTCPLTPTNCQGGLVIDYCGCCEVCGNLKDQQCKGIWNIEGFCDTHLKCVAEPDADFQQPGLCKCKAPGEDCGNKVCRRGYKRAYDGCPICECRGRASKDESHFSNLKRFMKDFFNTKIKDYLSDEFTECRGWPC